MLGTILGGALGIGGAIFGGVSASKAMKKAKGIVERGKSENESWYNRRYNEDSTQRADAQRVLSGLDERIRQRNKESAGIQAVMGGTEESVGSTKAANSEAMAEAAAQIALNGERRKEQAEAQYREADSRYDEKLYGIESNRAAGISQAASGVMQAGAKIADALDKEMLL